MAWKRSGVRFPLAPQIRTKGLVNRPGLRRFWGSVGEVSSEGGDEVLGRLSEQSERVDVARTDHREVTVVEGGDRVLVQTLCESDYGRVRGAEREVGVLVHQLCHAPKVRWSNRLDLEARMGE